MKKKFKPSYEPGAKVERYRPGQVPAWAKKEEEEKKKKEEEEKAAAKKEKKSKRDKTAAAVVVEDRSKGRLARLQAAAAANSDAGAERLLRHRVVHDAQVLESAYDGGADSISAITARMKDSLREKLGDKLDKKDDDIGVKDVKELAELKDEDLDIDRPPVMKEEVKAEVKEEDDEDKIMEQRAKARERALAKRKEEEDNLLKQQEEEMLVADEEESEYETESDDDGPGKGAMLKPIFVSKAQRQTVHEKAALEKEEEAAEERRQEKLKERKLESKAQVIDVIQKEVDAEAAAALGLDDTSDVELIDDNDEVNEAEEYELWKIRELKRIKRDDTKKLAREQELELIERRRNMTDEERAADDERMDGGKTFREDAKNFAFMQKYYHRGTFFQDKAETGEEPLYLRDYHEPVADEKFDKTTLPKVMQVRRGMFGKKGQTKHTHLAEVDTTDKSAAWSQHSKVNDRYQQRMASASGVNTFSRPAGNR